MLDKLCGCKQAPHCACNVSQHLVTHHSCMQAKLGKVPILAEDLGVITSDVVQLRWGGGSPQQTGGDTPRLYTACWEQTPSAVLSWVHLTVDS
jgi:hypothetical protein